MDSPERLVVRFFFRSCASRFPLESARVRWRPGQTRPSREQATVTIHFRQSVGFSTSTRLTGDFQRSVGRSPSRARTILSELFRESAWIFELNLQPLRQIFRWSKIYTNFHMPLYIVMALADLDALLKRQRTVVLEPQRHPESIGSCARELVRTATNLRASMLR